MAAPEHDESFVDRLSRQGEEALGKIAEELIGEPGHEWRDRARLRGAREGGAGAGGGDGGSQPALGRRHRAGNPPARSLSQRLEGIEDAIDRLEERVAAAAASGDQRLARIEARLDEIAP